jgi:mannan endo-1,4-beta-mannosidase
VIRAIFLSGGPAWLFVKAVTLTFALIALWRLLPGPNRQVPRYRPRRTRTVACCATALVLAAAVAGCVSLQARRDHSASRARRKRTAASAEPYLGVFEPGDTASWSPVADFGDAAGRQPDIVLYYSGWQQPFPTGFARAAQAHGATVLVQLLPRHISMAAVAQGRYDAYLRPYATAVRAFASKVIISFAPEMNGNWYSWGWRHTPPAVWVRAWRHVVTVFRRAGARNVTWLWTVNRQYPGSGPLRDYWPGSAYVTWAGIDGYIDTRTETFGNVIAPTVAAIRQITSTPVLLSETAIGPAADPVAEMPGLFRGVTADRLLGLVWFDQAQHGGIHHQDWRLEDDPAAMAAFHAALHAYFKQPRAS